MTRSRLTPKSSPKLRPTRDPEAEKAELLALRDQIIALIEQDLRKAATILTEWSNQDARSAPASPSRKKAG